MTHLFAWVVLSLLYSGIVTLQGKYLAGLYNGRDILTDLYVELMFFFKISDNIISTPFTRTLTFLCLITLKVWTLWPVVRANNMAVFLVSFSKSKFSRGCHRFKKVSTMFGSQVAVYLGAKGLILKTPLKQRFIRSSLPIWLPITSESADRWQFNVW